MIQVPKGLRRKLRIGLGSRSSRRRNTKHVTKRTKKSVKVVLAVRPHRLLREKILARMAATK